MIEYKSGDLLRVTNGVIVHGCNAQGVMNSGVAKLIRAKYPVAYHSYLLHCKKPIVLLGSVDLHYVTHDLAVANCITQQYYGRDPTTIYVNYAAITSCFSELSKITSEINIPKIGAGLANGDWSIISSIIESVYPGKVTCWEL